MTTEQPQPEQSYSVLIVEAQDVQVGDAVWAPDDGDWFKVRHITRARHGEIVFERSDGSEMTADGDDDRLLRRLESRS